MNQSSSTMQKWLSRAQKAILGAALIVGTGCDFGFGPGNINSAGQLETCLATLGGVPDPTPYLSYPNCSDGKGARVNFRFNVNGMKFAKNEPGAVSGLIAIKDPNSDLSFYGVPVEGGIFTDIGTLPLEFQGPAAQILDNDAVKAHVGAHPKLVGAGAVWGCYTVAKTPPKRNDCDGGSQPFLAIGLDANGLGAPDMIAVVVLASTTPNVVTNICGALSQDPLCGGFDLGGGTVVQWLLGSVRTGGVTTIIK